MIQLGEVPLSLGIMLIESVDKFLEHELDVGAQSRIEQEDETEQWRGQEK
jgi:hypothetical protein